MNNNITRILVFIIGLPLLFCSVFFFPDAHYAVFTVIVVIAAGFSAVEINGFYKTKEIKMSPVYSLIVGITGPVTAYFVNLGIVNTSQFIFILIAMISVIFVSNTARSSRKDFDKILSKTSAFLFILVYPGLFAYFAVRTTSLPHASLLVPIFLISVYINDSSAYVTGTIFSKAKRDITSVSPNKSMAGFVGGFTVGVLFTLLMKLLFPVLFPGSYYKTLIFAAIIGICTIFGDLIESGFKRSAGQKDSGNIVPGRGGVLDSIDSPLFCAPIFYYAYVLFYLQ
jgi:phosphatidate cytidylyltransferase